MPSEPDKPARKRAPETKATAKPKDEPAKPKLVKVEDEPKPDVEAKEQRGRSDADPRAGKEAHPSSRSDKPSSDDEAKRLWKESRNQMPGPVAVDRNREEPEEVEPPRERTAEEQAAKDQRGLVRYPTP